LFGTGTGIAPFASLVRNPEVYEKYQKIILVHGARKTAELRYGNEMMKATLGDLLVGAAAQQSLIFINATTRESYRLEGRLTDLLDDGVLEKTAGVAFDPAYDRAMLCGSLGFTNDFRLLLTDRGLGEGSNARPGGFVYEKSFVG
jgi:ferredoxin--NADP+ reductase